MARRTPSPTNGHADIAATAPAPQIQRQEVWIDLGDDYPGFRLRIWRNFRFDALLAMQRLEATNDFPGLIEHLRGIVLAHNGWLDAAGATLPPPTDAAFWNGLPFPMFAAVIHAIGAEAQRMPGFPQPTRTT